jgi:hypothetical protein
VLPRRYSLTLLLPLDFNEIDDPHEIAEDATQWKFFVHAQHQGGVSISVDDSGVIEMALPHPPSACCLKDISGNAMRLLDRLRKRQIHGVLDVWEWLISNTLVVVTAGESTGGTHGSDRGGGHTATFAAAATVSAFCSICAV